MRNQFILIFLLFIQIKVWCQTVILNEISIDSDSISKMVDVEIIVNEINLDTINRLKLLDQAFAHTKNLNSFASDSFHTDGYSDNYDNKYTIVFDSIPNEVNNFERVTGVLRYFYPSIENKSIVIIENGNEAFNSNILDQNSKEIKIVPINGFILHRSKKRKRRLNKYLTEIILENDLDKNLFIETLSRHFEDYQDFKMIKKLSDFILFYIEQPSFKVVSIKIEDSNSKNRDGYYSIDINSKLNGPESALWISSNRGGKLKSNYNIEIRYENSKSIQDFEFELLNIELQ